MNREELLQYNEQLCEQYNNETDPAKLRHLYEEIALTEIALIYSRPPLNELTEFEIQ